jgi:hypothetical protein
MIAIEIASGGGAVDAPLQPVIIPVAARATAVMIREILAFLFIAPPFQSGDRPEGAFRKPG